MRSKKEESIGTDAMHPMALAHHKASKHMKKAVKKIRRHSKEDLQKAYKHMKDHGG